VRRYTSNISTVAHCSITTMSHVAGRNYLAAYANDHHLRDMPDEMTPGQSTSA
jgi:hypothetical protein